MTPVTPMYMVILAGVAERWRGVSTVPWVTADRDTVDTDTGTRGL